MRMTTTWAIFALAVAACADHGAASSTDAGPDAGTSMPADGGAASPAVDAAGDAATDAATGMPAMLVVGASSGTVTDAFALSASGTARSPYGSVSFTSDVGTIDLGNGAAAGFVYATVAEGGYTLYDGFAVSPTSWDAFYLYCNNGALADVYDERVAGHGMVYAPVTGGACSSTAVQTAAHVSLPAFSIAAPTPVGGYTVTGPSVDIAGDGTGTLVVGSARLPLVVFDDVDCSACGGAGWFELHTIVWDAAHQRAVFLIVYLINGTASSVEIAYARSLPDLGDPLGTRTLEATWTVPTARRAPSLRGIAPPSMRSSEPADRSSP
jgi:hypothetical protein